jgi:hypothetical protein
MRRCVVWTAAAACDRGLCCKDLPTRAIAAHHLTLTTTPHQGDQQPHPQPASPSSLTARLAAMSEHQLRQHILADRVRMGQLAAQLKEAADANHRLQLETQQLRAAAAAGSGGGGADGAMQELLAELQAHIRDLTMQLGDAREEGEAHRWARLLDWGGGLGALTCRAVGLKSRGGRWYWDQEVVTLTNPPHTLQTTRRAAAAAQQLLRDSQPQPGSSEAPAAAPAAAAAAAAGPPHEDLERLQRDLQEAQRAAADGAERLAAADARADAAAAQLEASRSELAAARGRLAAADQQAAAAAALGLSPASALVGPESPLSEFLVLRRRRQGGQRRA